MCRKLHEWQVFLGPEDPKFTLLASIYDVMDAIKLSYIPRAMSAIKCGPQFNGQQKIFTKFSEICKTFLIPQANIQTKTGLKSILRRVILLRLTGGPICVFLNHRGIRNLTVTVTLCLSCQSPGLGNILVVLNCKCTQNLFALPASDTQPGSESPSRAGSETLRIDECDTLLEIPCYITYKLRKIMFPRIDRCKMPNCFCFV